MLCFSRSATLLSLHTSLVHPNPLSTRIGAGQQSRPRRLGSNLGTEVACMRVGVTRLETLSSDEYINQTSLLHFGGSFIISSSPVSACPGVVFFFACLTLLEHIAARL